jgi:hypothetical protein
MKNMPVIDFDGGNPRTPGSGSCFSDFHLRPQPSDGSDERPRNAWTGSQKTGSMRAKRLAAQGRMVIRREILDPSSALQLRCGGRFRLR